MEIWKSMIPTLSLLADEIASLRRFGTACGDDVVGSLAERLASAFTHVLDDVAENPSTLAGEMPSWRQRTRD
ncbi:hypothetical protein [Sphingomonas nostoxanthinifaciens]|uniref:hypothetical protein n=1 Tax=Sphingomonas nostoxanthinifaciens TaxID=2872652 RepID=UPI001CC1DF76|nr:hypothetical protein [Sphingomonas nostoxanthinifaciens]UAK25735.1 hypothetical protein K8P63_06265 [Sphingomonas nostoxanthinifaciens]